VDNYGIPPKLNQRFQTTGKGQMFDAPHRSNLKGQVLELPSRGIVYTAIADTLNMSDSRVKDIIRAAAALSGRHNGQAPWSAKGSRLVGLALRPEFRLKARRPSIEPLGPGDDKSRGKQSSSCRASRAALAK
jgi:hypothetical protein